MASTGSSPTCSGDLRSGTLQMLKVKGTTRVQHDVGQTVGQVLDASG